MKKEKKREPRVKKVKVDIAKLHPAVIDGKCVLKPKSQVVFERTQNSKTALHEGELFSVDERTITLWDETRGQMFSFALTDPVPCFARFVEDVIKKESDDV